MSDDQRIEELEVKLAFQEETIRSLSETVAGQTQDLLRLEDELGRIKEAVRRMADRVPASEDDDAPW